MHLLGGHKARPYGFNGDRFCSASPPYTDPGFLTSDPRVDGCDETVTPALQGFHKPGLIGGIAQCLAQAVDGVVQPVVEVGEGVGRPESLVQFPRVTTSPACSSKIARIRNG